MAGGGREEVLGLPGQTGFSGASESSESEFEGGDLGEELGNLGVDGGAERFSSSDGTRIRRGALGDGVEGEKTGVAGTFEKSSSEI